MPTPTKGEGDLSHIHIFCATSSHQVDFIFHLSQGDHDLQVFHFHELVHHDCEVADVLLPGHLRDHDLNAVDDLRCGRGGEIIEEPYLFCGEFSRQHVRDEVWVGPLFKKPGCRPAIVRCGGDEGQRTGVLMDAKVHDRGFVGGERNIFLASGSR